MRTIYPGQVSVTADTWLSVQHALPEGVSPVDLGAHKLRCKTVMLEPCNGVRFEQHRDIMDSLGSDHPSEPASRTTSMTASEIRVDFLDDLSDGTGDSNKNAEYDVSLYNVSHRILHERVYPPLRSLRCSSPGYYDSPKPSEGVAIVFCKPRLPKNLNSAAAEKARQRWASIARALLPVYAGYECKSPETGQFTLAFTRMENAIGFCTNAQAMMSQFAARDDSGGWPKELLDAEAKEAKGTEAAVKKEREEARAKGLKKVNFVTDTSQLAAHQSGQRGLRVSMGIAYGNNCFRKPLLETGRADYFGPLANLAARVMSCAHGGQVLVEGVPLLWKDRERFRGAVHWFPNDASDADALKHRELWCERSKTAIDTMMGTFNVPWFLVVNAGKAATQMLMKEMHHGGGGEAAAIDSPVRPSIDGGGGVGGGDSAGEPAMHLLSNLRATLEQKSERDIGAWIRQGGVGGLDMETGTSESALALCARGFCELKGFPQKTPLVEARSPALKPAKFPAVNAQKEAVVYDTLAGPRPPRAWEPAKDSTSSMDRSSKYYGGKSGSKLASIVLGITGSGNSHSRRGGGKKGSKWNVVRDAVEERSVRGAAVKRAQSPKDDDETTTTPSRRRDPRRDPSAPVTGSASARPTTAGGPRKARGSPQRKRKNKHKRRRPRYTRPLRYPPPPPPLERCSRRSTTRTTTRTTGTCAPSPRPSGTSPTSTPNPSRPLSDEPGAKRTSTPRIPRRNRQLRGATRNAAGRARRIWCRVPGRRRSALFRCINPELGLNENLGSTASTPPPPTTSSAASSATRERREKRENRRRRGKLRRAKTIRGAGLATADEGAAGGAAGSDVGIRAAPR